MKKFEIEDIKAYMNDIITKEKFDSFYLHELRLRTGLDYYISGRVNASYYDTEEQDSLPEYISWKDIKQTVFELVKGDRLPISIKLVLMFNRDNITRLIEMNNLPLSEDDIGALFLNVYYENEKLVVTTGSSLKTFSLDKTLDNVWDETVEKYYI